MAFPAYRSSRAIQTDEALERIEIKHYMNGWPFHQGESAREALQGVAASLTPSVQPFEQQLRHLGSEGITHLVVVGDGVIIQMAYKLFLGLDEQALSLQAVPYYQQPDFRLFSFARNFFLDVRRLI